MLTENNECKCGFAERTANNAIETTIIANMVDVVVVAENGFGKNYEQKKTNAVYLTIRRRKKKKKLHNFHHIFRFLFKITKQNQNRKVSSKQKVFTGSLMLFFSSSL